MFLIYFCFRGDEGVDVVPNFDWICPREKVEVVVSKTFKRMQENGLLYQFPFLTSQINFERCKQP